MICETCKSKAKTEVAVSKDVNQNQRRVDVKGILDDPKKRRKLMTGVIRATQAREGIETTQEQADDAYDAALAQRPSLNGTASTASASSSKVGRSTSRGGSQSSTNGRSGRGKT